MINKKAIKKNSLFLVVSIIIIVLSFLITILFQNDKLLLEEKELEVVLKWQNANNHLGITKNIVEIANTDNPAKYPDNNPDDNISDAEVIISVKTGKEILSEISILGGTLGLITLLGVIVVDIKKHKAK